MFEDETTDMLFAFKKYVPKDLEFIDEYYMRFVNEIKILFKISHPNIVRVYNYYLYPEHKTGYLQMEYIEGSAIDEFDANFWGKNWDDIFIEVVDAFEYLELKGILHRDIRPANILIDTDFNVKVIDFGFGKKLEKKEHDGKSVALNWPVTEYPEEILLDGTYNHKTEIYFIGKLFQHLLANKLNEFKFEKIIKKMIQVNPTQRYKSFSEVSEAISTGILNEIDFTDTEKKVYLAFADQLSSHIARYVDKYETVNDVNITIKLLASLISDSALEEYIQANNRLISCFINGRFSYYQDINIEVDYVKNFYELLIRLAPQKQRIVLDNIYTRLSKIKVEADDEIPF